MSRCHRRKAHLETFLQMNSWLEQFGESLFNFFPSMAPRRTRILTIKNTVRTYFSNRKCSGKGEGLQSEVSRLCKGLPGQGGSPAELGGTSADLEMSLCNGMTRSKALLFSLGVKGRGGWLDNPVSGGGMKIEFRLVGGSSSLSFSSMRGI